MRRILLVAGLTLGLLSPAASQNIKISALPSATTPSGTEVLPVVQSGVTKKITVNQIISAGTGAFQPLDTDLTAIAGLTTTSTGRDLLTSSNSAAIRTKAGVGTIGTQDSASVSITGGSITGITDLAIADGGTGGSDAATARTNLGLGTLSLQNAGTVAITGGTIANTTISSATVTSGTITGITDLAVADGGTGASDAAGARTNLGLGSMATQNAGAVSISGGSVTGITDLALADGGTGASDAAGARTNLGLGSMSLQSSGAVSISGGTVAGITDLAVADGGTGASDAATARTNLGLGTIATQGAGAVAITGGTISGATVSSVSVTSGTITGITDLAVTDGGTGASDAATARSNLGLGSISTQSASSVAITGGSVTGITDLALADGGTGASDAATARTNLGLGTMATQGAGAVAITGGSVTGITDLAVADGGTASSTAAGARTNLGAAASGANSDITALTGLTSAPIGQHPGYVAGRWYVPGEGSVIFNATTVANSIRFRPFRVEQSITVSDLAVRVNVVSAGGNVQLAIYASNSSTKYPTGSAIASTSGISTTTAATVSGALGVSAVLTPGLYWLGENADNSVAGISALNSVNVHALVGTTDLTKVITTTATDNVELRLAQTYGTWPNVTASAFVETTYAPVAFAMKIGSVP